MSISQYLKSIGRGARGARSLTREQSADVFGQVLDKRVTDLEIGAFCLAMRIKGETVDEMAGFIDAAMCRNLLVPPSPGNRSTVVLPSYNGARKLPILTPLLGLLLVERGIRVVIHGVQTDPGRTTTMQVLSQLGHAARRMPEEVQDDAINFFPLEVLSAPLHQLLEVRRVVGLRNSAHSLVKLINPTQSRALVVGSYTHSAYATTMTEIYQLLGADAMLLRGIEGEPVADARKIQEVDVFVAGQKRSLQDAETRDASVELDWPIDLSAEAIGLYVQDVLQGRKPIPIPVLLQVRHIEDTLEAMKEDVHVSKSESDRTAFRSSLSSAAMASQKSLQPETIVMCDTVRDR